MDCRRRPTWRIRARAVRSRPALNGRQYLDVTFADPGGSGLDPGSITDPGAEFTLSGSAAAGVVVDGAAVLVSGSTYRYAFSGSFAEGPVQLDFAAGSWQDTAQNVNLAESESFQVTVPAAEIILDNRDAEVTFGGSWGTASNIPGFHGPDYRHDNKTGKGSKTATFQPALAVAGTYDVYMQWSGSSIYSDNVPVDIVHAGGTSTVLVNQKTNGNQWNLLGNYAFVAGSSGHVTIRTDGTTGYVMADAVRFVRTTDTIAPSADLADPSPGGSISAGAQRPPVPGRDVCRSRGQRPGPGLDRRTRAARVHAERVGGGGRGGRRRGGAGQRQHVSLRVQRQLCGRPRPGGLRGGQLAGHRSEREPGRE